MPTIPKYTKTEIRRRVVPDTTDPSAVQAAAAPFEAGSRLIGLGSEMAFEAAEQITIEQQKKKSRYDTIQAARGTSAYQKELDADFTKFSSEQDLTNPDAVKEFNTMIRGKQSAYLSQYAGNPEAKQMYEIELMGLTDKYSLKMSETARGAQRQFITTAYGNEVNRIASEAYTNPANIDIAFRQLDGLDIKYGNALDDVDQMQLLDNAQSAIVESALNSFIDAGDYNSASTLVQNNEKFITAMPPEKQMSVLSRISKGIQAQEQQQNEISNKMKSYEKAAQEAGVNITKSQMFSAITGINETQTPDQKVTEFAKIAGLSQDEITPSLVAKIGFGVDLPSEAQVDETKDRTPSGDYTAQGLGKIIKNPYDNAANTKVQVEKVLLQADEFIRTDNAQAGLAAMVAFQKLIDDGAAVREGDIQLSAQGNSAFDNLKLMMDRVAEGAIATPKQIEQMKQSAKLFGQAVLESSKTFIDPYLENGIERGYTMLQIGLPRSSYDMVFKDIKTAEDKNQRNTEIEEKAKSYGMSVNEYLTSTAGKRNLTVKQVADKLGYTGKLQ